MDQNHQQKHIVTLRALFNKSNTQFR